jgi:hypothetical protein
MAAGIQAVGRPKPTCRTALLSRPVRLDGSGEPSYGYVFTCRSPKETDLYFHTVLYFNFAEAVKGL